MGLMKQGKTEVAGVDEITQSNRWATYPNSYFSSDFLIPYTQVKVFVKCIYSK